MSLLNGLYEALESDFSNEYEECEDYVCDTDYGDVSILEIKEEKEDDDDLFDSLMESADTDTELTLEAVTDPNFFSEKAFENFIGELIKDPELALENIASFEEEELSINKDPNEIENKECNSNECGSNECDNGNCDDEEINDFLKSLECDILDDDESILDLKLKLEENEEDKDESILDLKIKLEDEEDDDDNDDEDEEDDDDDSEDDDEEEEDDDDDDDVSSSLIDEECDR